MKQINYLIHDFRFIKYLAHYLNKSIDEISKEIETVNELVAYRILIKTDNPIEVVGILVFNKDIEYDNNLKCYPSIDVITTEDIFLLEDGLLPNLLNKYNKQLSKEELINFYTGYFNWTVGNEYIKQS